MDAMDRQFEDEQDTLRKTLEKRGTSRDEIKVILDRRREGYETDNRPPRVMETVIPKDPIVTKWDGGEGFVRAQGYGIYCDGRLIGIMESAELAELVANAHNATLKKRSFTI
ncbi:MAG: hypothetical protein HQK86_11935 [Nitrospinae bacterium]|nr:hypothetical protein [Nitrospinota bacterium]MBF0633550.1 hypothetical protein [Nitrospinota bacterium]